MASLALNRVTLFVFPADLIGLKPIAALRQLAVIKRRICGQNDFHPLETF